MASNSKPRRRGQRAITAGKIRKLQRAGMLRGVDPNARPSKYTLSQLYKYRGVISGRQAAVRLSSADKAKVLRQRIGEGGQGRVVIVPREKGERFTVKNDIVSSRRTQYGQTIEKTIGDKFTPPKANEKVYYTLPRRKRGLGSLKRRTFASFDEMLFYLSKYEINLEDIEDYIEVEKFVSGSRREKQKHAEYKEQQRAAYRRAKRRHKHSKRRGR